MMGRDLSSREGKGPTPVAFFENKNPQQTKLGQKINLDKFFKAPSNFSAVAMKDGEIVYERYNEKLKQIPIVIPFQEKDNCSAYHLYVIRLELAKINKTHKKVFEHLREKGIGVNLHYIPVYKQPYYEVMGYSENDFPEAEAYYSEAISLPIYPELSFSEQDKVIEALIAVINGD